MKRVAIAVCAVGCGRFHFDREIVTDAPAAIDVFSGVVRFGETSDATYTNVTSDAALWAAMQGANYGVGPESAFQPDQHVLFRFDVSVLPPGTNIRGATFQFFVPNSGDVSAGLIDARLVTESWDEGTLDGMAGAPNWLARTSTSNWMTAGGTFGAVIGTLSATGADGPIAMTIDPSAVQSWVDSPAQNFGFGIVTTTGHRHSRMSESPTPSERPVLELAVGP